MWKKWTAATLLVSFAAMAGVSGCEEIIEITGPCAPYQLYVSEIEGDPARYELAFAHAGERLFVEIFFMDKRRMDGYTEYEATVDGVLDGEDTARERKIHTFRLYDEGRIEYQIDLDPWQEIPRLTEEEKDALIEDIGYTAYISYAHEDELAVLKAIYREIEKKELEVSGR